MDEIEINGDEEALNFHAENEDLFAVPPPLAGQLLADDPANIDQAQDDTINPEDNVADDALQDAEKKKKKRAFKPRVILNEERLCSENGIKALKNLCSDEKFKGKGHEVSDLNKLLYRFEHWAQCLMPRLPFKNVVKKCELLGSKSRCRNELKRVRSNDEDILRGEPEDDEGTGAAEGDDETTNEEHPTEAAPQQNVPSAEEERPPKQLTEEQLERIRRNRLLAFERREANKRRKLAEERETQSHLEDPQNTEVPIPTTTDVSSANTEPEEIIEPKETIKTKETIKDAHEDIAPNGEDQIQIDNIINCEGIDSNVDRHNYIPESNYSSQLSDVNSDNNSDSDNDILSRSAFLPSNGNIILQDNSDLNNTTENIYSIPTVLEND